MTAIRVALTRRWAQIWTSSAKATANSPVTSSAAQTVAPRGTDRSPSAIAIARKATQATATCDEREREDVVAVGVALDHHDLERLRDGAHEDEQVARRRALGNAGQQREAEEREPDGRPELARDRRPEERERRAAA